MVSALFTMNCQTVRMEGLRAQKFTIAVAVATLLGCALFLFVDRRIPPIIIWDESRLAVNALEMHLRGFGLVTTYGFAPDLWNTKPPLAIWLMSASIGLFGPSELALRLPAMLAALATLAIVFAFVRAATRALWPAMLAAVLLAASIGFYGEHGARTGDYDALLCLFTTSYLCLLFRVVHQRRPSWRPLVGAALLVAAATMTKSVAGLLPGLGVALYLVASRRLTRVLGCPRYWIALPLALLPIAAFYAAREASAPGYLHAIWYNDIAGRYARALDRHGGAPTYYLRAIFVDGLFSVGPIAVLTPLGLVAARGRARAALLFALCCVAGELLVVSTSATKLPQYVLPALPWLAIACAIAAHAAWPALRGARLPLRLAAGLVVATLAVPSAIRSIDMRYGLLAERQYYPQAGYGALLAALHREGVSRVLLVDRGVEADGLSAYAPQLDYYALLWRTRGMRVERVTTLPADAREPIASCDPYFVAQLHGQPLGFPGCSVR
jgi:4-amino-4-deoxy-L-arabinose transferase-like glycosyltransferase